LAKVSNLLSELTAMDNALNLGHLNLWTLFQYFCLWDHVKQMMLRMKIHDMDHFEIRMRDTFDTPNVLHEVWQ